jgi:hypothetical protein
MDFNTFIGKAWNDHASDAHAVARRLSDGMALVADESQLARLAELAHHVHGEHLGEWRAGLAFMERLAALAPYTSAGASGQALRRCAASLALSERDDADLGVLALSDRIRVGAMAAANLAERDTGRAQRLLEDALEQARCSGLDATDPMNRALAIAGHNLACTLEKKPARSAAERALMIQAAQASRLYWERAGTWLETERAEYRLAMTWLQAGDAARARAHAQACLEIVSASDGAALERLFGWEALGLVECAAGNPAAHAEALAQAREAFAALDESDQAWCAASLEALAAASATVATAPTVA